MLDGGARGAALAQHCIMGAVRGSCDQEWSHVGSPAGKPGTIVMQTALAPLCERHARRRFQCVSQTKIQAEAKCVNLSITSPQRMED